VPKQFQPLAGVPILLRAIRPFASHPDVAHVAVVLPAEDAGAPPEWLAPLQGPALSLVAGGAERTDSAMAGLQALPAACVTVLVHDGARPFVPREVIDSVIAVARRGEGAVPAMPLSDTLKQAAEPGPAPLVRTTISRTGLWRAQTPQGFPRASLEWGYEQARLDGLTATDDAALVERIGTPVRLVPGSARNLKITTAEDLAFAELLAGSPG
jgi:2-C-methyl-D-erythritol 4-phosphate cytidylyltransferase